MKKILFPFVLLACTFSFAQIESFDTTHISAIKKDLKGAFTEIVKENLTLTDEQAKVFWPIYDEYIAARNPIFEERVSVTEEYMMNYYAMDDATAKDLINRALQLNQDLLDVRKEYVNKMLDKLSPSLVGKFFQIDNRVTTLADLVRMSSTPLIRDEE
ncbi:MAG TPA: Spy/CpxP family protein refolding chaperone [Ignavibacteriaceae bacterium]